ncbi:MAG: ATP-binding protein, partial [Rhodospirillaceae bacterium]|nr:ATP-binding protein [Rhodospirillaceae bacterium]
FEPFNRLGREAGEIEGTGIGLTITKQIIELLGGEIGIESEAGAGASFWIDLPISRNN